MTTRSTFRIFFSFILLGLLTAAVFPFYANFFVIWKPGMLKYFIAGCIVAGLLVGIGNFLIFRILFRRLLRKFYHYGHQGLGNHFNASENTDLVDNFFETSTSLIDTLQARQAAILRTSTQVSDGVNEINHNTEDAESALSHISSFMDETAKVTLEGRALLDQTGKSFEALANSFSTTQTEMEALSETSTKIDSMLRMIQDIAFQTRLLATNASVEAVHAGASGGGFGVVANEVSQLANRSSVMAKEITETMQAFRKKLDDSNEAHRRNEAHLRQQKVDLSRSRKTFESIESMTAQAQSEVEALMHGMHTIVKLSQQFSEESHTLRKELQTKEMDETTH